MASISNDWHLHMLVLLVSGGEDLLEILRQALKFRLAKHLRFQNGWLYLDCIALVQEWRPIEIPSVHLGRHGCPREVIILLIEFVEAARSLKESLSIILAALLVVHGHHVLQIVSSIIVLGTFKDASISLLVVGLACRRLESLLVDQVAPASDLVRKTLGRGRGIALSVDIFGLDSRDEACVAWDALVANLMLRTIDPGD